MRDSIRCSAGADGGHNRPINGKCAGKKINLKSETRSFAVSKPTNRLVLFPRQKNWERGNPVRVVGGTTFDNYWTDSGCWTGRKWKERRRRGPRDKSKKSLVPSSGLRKNLSDWTTAMAPAERVS